MVTTGTIIRRKQRLKVQNKSDLNWGRFSLLYEKNLLD